MPNQSLPYLQHRQTTGHHTYRQDRKQRTQRAEDKHVKQMAELPGRHAANVDSQNVTNAALQLLLVFSGAQSSSTSFAVNAQRAEELTMLNRLSRADALFQRQRMEDAYRREFERNSSPEAGASSGRSSQPTSLEHTSKSPRQMRNRRSLSSGEGLDTATNAIIKLPVSVNEQHTIVSRQVVLSASAPDAQNKVVAEDTGIVGENGKSLDKVRYFYQVFDHDGATISRRKIQPVEKFCEKIRSICPDMKKMASDLLKAEIKKKFSLDIDPDHTYFMHFDWAMNDRNAFTGFSHGGKPIEERTLTECLFVNFPADAQDNPMAVDQQAGIYRVSSKETSEFNGLNQERIRPSELMKVIWDMDFFETANAKLTTCWGNREIHKVNNAVTFSLQLSESKAQLSEDDMSDVLRGVSYIKNNGETKVYPFDINGYEATDMLVFENVRSGSRVLYMPRSEISFVAFNGEFEMREWIINNCADKEHRAMISNHFSIEKRQDGIIYSGVDYWLSSFENVIEPENELNKICSKKNKLNIFDVFSFMTARQAERSFSDLNKLITSNNEVRKRMWTNFFDAGNAILPNPVTPFISMGLHIDRMVNGDTLNERTEGWHQVGSDLKNLILMAMLSGLTECAKIDFEVGGEEFVSDVRRDLSRFTADKTLAFDKILPVEKFSNEKFNFETRVATASQEAAIRMSEDILPKLANMELRIPPENLSPPDENGVAMMSAGANPGETNVIRIGNKFFEIKETNDFGSCVIGGKNGVEVFFDEGVYYEKIKNAEIEINYKPCIRSKRSPNQSCMHLSDNVKDILEVNLDKAIPEGELRNLVPKTELTGIFKSQVNDKLYLKYDHVYFEVVLEKGKGFSVFANSEDPVLRRKITDLFFSTKNGPDYLNTEIERSMEALNISRPAAELHVNQRKYIKNLTKDEIESLYAYGRSNHDSINDFMRQGMPDDYLAPWIRPMVNDQVNEIRSGLLKIPPYKGKVFRGTCISEKIVDQINVGDIVKNKAFLSTSLDRNVAERFVERNWSGRKPMMYEITVDKTAHPISQITLKLDEAELLIEDHIYFRVLSKDEGFIQLEELTEPAAIAENGRVIAFDT